MRSRRFAALSAVVLLAPALLGACGSPSRLKPSALASPREVTKATPTVYPARTPSAVPTASAVASASESGAPGGGPGGAGSGNAVAATADNKFTPQKLTVKAGTEVTWTASGFHTVTGGADGKEDGSSPMKSGMGFQTYKVTFDKPGTYPYFCQPHFSVGMTGEIIVT